MEKTVSGKWRIHKPVLINGFAFTLNKPQVSAKEMTDLERAIREDGTTYLNRADVDGVPHLRCSFSNWSIEEKDMKKVAEALIRIGKTFI